MRELRGESGLAGARRYGLVKTLGGRIVSDQNPKSTKDPSGSDSSFPSEAHRLAHEYAWSWFEYHAQQRLQLFNFSIVALGALAAASATFLSQAAYIAAGLTAVFAGALAIAFLRLDQRNSELTRLAERYLASGTEGNLAPIVGDNIRLASNADKPGSRIFYTFGQIARAAYSTCVLAAAGVVMFAVAKTICGG